MLFPHSPESASSSSSFTLVEMTWKGDVLLWGFPIRIAGSSNYEGTFKRY